MVLCLMLPLFCMTAAAETVIVSVDSTNLRFTPSEVTITEGDEVRFFWSGQALPHNAVAKDGFFSTGDPEREVDHTDFGSPPGVQTRNPDTLKDPQTKPYTWTWKPPRITRKSSAC